MARVSAQVWLVPALLLALSCGGTGTSDAGFEKGAGGSTGSAGGPGSPGGASGASGAGGKPGGIIGPGPTPSADCQGGVGDVIFVVSAENVLLRFEPQKLVFTSIGALSCPTTAGDTPFSMAVDRSGTAFVLYQSGNIFKASTVDASCQPSGYSPDQQGFSRFGMGYVSDAAGGSAESLYVIDGTAQGTSGNAGLGIISFQGALSPVGQFTMGLSGRAAEVTGRADGRLFGFFVDANDPSQTSVAEIDKATAKVVSNVAQDLPQISAWAFAHWGGSFYLFNGYGSSPSRVHKYTPGVGTTQVVDNAGYSIVGAGVSTCAPLVEPPLK